MLKKLYLAGLMSLHKKDWAIDGLKSKRFVTLESFWNAQMLEQVLPKEKGFKIFLDSGAYSWHSTLINKGIKPTEAEEREYLDRYIQFIHKYSDRFYAYANLDVVGDPVRTQENQEYMEKSGLLPVAVFHYSPKQKDPVVQEQEFQYLRQMIERYDYIALGGGASEGITGVKYMKNYGDSVFSIIEESGRAIKVHGFGVTSVPLMLRYAWHSVDSTTWIKIAAYGGVILPRYSAFKQGLVFDQPPTIIKVSEQAKYVETGKGHFLKSYSKKGVERILEYFDSINVDSKILETDYYERARVNCIFFEKFVESLANLPEKKNYMVSNQKFF